jgi:hypothetical protein
MEMFKRMTQNEAVYQYHLCIKEKMKNDEAQKKDEKYSKLIMGRFGSIQISWVWS